MLDTLNSARAQVLSGVGAYADATAFLLVDSAVKSCLLLLTVLVAARLMRRRSAAAIHRLWVLAFCGCLAIPFVGLAAPGWSVPVVPDLWLRSDVVSREPAATETPGDEAPADPSDSSFPTGFAGMPVMDPAMIPPAVERVPAVRESSEVRQSERDRIPTSAGSTVAQAPERDSYRFSWTVACLAVWMSGALCCLLRTAWHHLLLARLLRRSPSLTDATWRQAVDDASRILGINQTVELRMREGALSPLMAGIVRTIIVLPADADTWDPARRRIVLLHELAHVKRRDVLSQTVAGTVCALYWFNPLCWVGLWQMRRLRELACDDLVLSSGQRPSDYARVLLDVARRYRHPNLAPTVGMMRNSQVEGRILALLDKARSHMSLSTRAARTLLVSAAALVLLIGSMRLVSQAEPPASPDADQDSPGEAAQVAAENRTEVASDEPRETSPTDDDVRTMEVTIQDEEGRPLEGARLHASVWELGGRNRFPNADYATDANGIAHVRLPRRLMILRLWPSQSGYVPEFVNFAQGTHDEGLKIPDRYEFQLSRGTELSGTVVDESGQPVSGVAVDVSVEVRSPAWTVNPKPIISTWLTDEDFNEGNAITDENGKWKITNAPAPVDGEDYTFRVKFTHDEYVSDSQWGELQNQQGLTTEMLRDGSARLVLQRGTSVTGTIVDSAGHPVTEGLVIWHDDPYHGQEVHETQIAETGRFETLPLPAGEFPITVVAPGFAPQRRMVGVSEEMDELRFVMQPGKRLTLKIVDQNDNPIPNAWVSIREWRGVNSLYNHDHPNVPDSRIPRRADENGVYVWDGAPEDAVTYAISAEQSAFMEVTLIARPEAHVVELAQRLVASGRVTDAATGEPVRLFRVSPVTVYRPGFLSTSFRDQVAGADGYYEIELSDRAEYEYRHQVRIDADGYRSAISEQTYGLEDGRVTQHFELEPAAAHEGLVVDSDGQAVASASVVQATPSILPSLQNNDLDFGGRSIETSGDGRFKLPATFEPVRLRVIHDSGFAEVLRQPDEPIGTIPLEPWASVSGTLLQDGNPVPDERVSFYPVLTGRLGEPRFQDSYSTQTDAEGRFEFKRLPPIAGSVRAYLGPWRDSPLTSSQAVPLDLQPGETRSITLGGGGVTITGRVVATGRGEATLDKNWSLNYLIRRDGGIELPAGFPELGFNPSGPVQASWFLDPNHYTWLAIRNNYFVKLAPEGELRVCGVPPGTYDLVVRLYEQPAGCLVETVGEKVVTIEVTASDAAAGTMDIGAIEVECRAGPRVGENMQLYQFTDTTGRVRSIAEMSGRYVLMHVWAAWCAPCLESMPHIQASVEDLADRPITFIGLNIDGEKSTARALVERRGWTWSQNYLGESSDIARQLAISTVPTYFLIAPDGLLVASTADWEEMKEQIEAALGESP